LLTVLYWAVSQLAYEPLLSNWLKKLSIDGVPLEVTCVS
jgi:hypothetical protein